MRKVALLSVVVGLAFAAPRLSRSFDEWMALRSAERRVDALLSAMVAANGSLDGLKAETAMCLWYKGALIITNQGEMGAAQDGYVDWRLANRLTRPIGAYELVSARIAEPPGLSPVLVLVRIDGQPYELQVPFGRPIS